MGKIILYGISKANKKYRAVAYWIEVSDRVSIVNLRNDAEALKEMHPDIAQVYAIDNRPGLVKEYRESYKADSIESCVLFKDTLETEGILII